MQELTLRLFRHILTGISNLVSKQWVPLKFTCIIRHIVASIISAPQSIDDDFLQLPEIMIDSHVNQDLERVILTIINYLWNAFGFVSKPEYG
ncbi:hypothetical protein [Paenibacillus sp. LjRoot153]|uniref:hypothetical protein n=1 Tax=Paenibacillus sp. LjRoot153 TaxID=3342270 RepID=UPI003F50C5E9